MSHKYVTKCDVTVNNLPDTIIVITVITFIANNWTSLNYAPMFWHRGFPRPIICCVRREFAYVQK